MHTHVYMCVYVLATALQWASGDNLGIFLSYHYVWGWSTEHQAQNRSPSPLSSLSGTGLLILSQSFGYS